MGHRAANCFIDVECLRLNAYQAVSLLDSEADATTEVKEGLIPTGAFLPVEGTPFDLRTPAVIGEGIDSAHPQLELGAGYDHNWVLNQADKGLTHAATVYHPGTGRQMDVHTAEPGVQFYAGNFLDGQLVGKSGKPYLRRSGLCLETQHYPDSPNQPEFPGTILHPGETYLTTTIYSFSTR